jgi:hypothetical protein
MRYFCLLLWSAISIAHGAIMYVPFPWGAAAGNHLVPDAIAFYKFDEGSGNATDASGNGKTLTDNGSVGAGTGVVGGSRTFTFTTSEFLERSYDAEFNLGSAFTIAGWVQFDDAPPAVDDMAIVAKGDTTTPGNFSYLLELDSGVSSDLISFYWSTDGTIDFGNVIQFDLGGDVAADWYFICLRWNGTTLHLSASYIGDPLAADVTASFSGTIFNDGTGSLRVGSLQGTPDHDLRGQADNLGFWNRYLSDCEVGKLFTAKSGSFTWPSFDSNPCVP